jgi:ABC-2 type transport system ATP-binding protein
VTVAVETQAILRAQGLSKRYGRTWALKDCTFELQPGKTTALVGANGAGKTTLLTVLSGLIAPDEGTVQPNGRIAFVAQEKALYKRFNPAEMLKLGSRLNHRWDQKRAERWLDRFEVDPHRPCGRLSGGQQAQVSLALALGSQPDLLLLDEPLASLDPLVRREVMSELLAESAETGLSLLMSTHVVAELAGVAENLLVLGRGRLVLDGDVDELLASHVYYVGPRAESPPSGEVVRASHHEQQSTFLVKPSGDRLAEPWISRPASIEDVVLAYLANTRDGGKA